MKSPYIILFIFTLLNTGCTIDPDVAATRDSAPLHVPDNLASIPDAIPRHETRTRAGNPGTYEVLGKQYTVMPDSKNYVQKGIASWYGSKFHGRKTSNGETYDMFAMTAAHKTLPIPSYVRVTNLQNRRSIVVRVNDRGPFHDNRIIDLSYTAAVKLGIQKTGTGFVEVRSVEPSSPQQQPANIILPVAAEKNIIYLQIGAFGERSNAFELRDRISLSQLPKPRIQSAMLQGNPIYKVQLGPVYSVDEADRLTQNLTDIGITNIHFVVEKTSSNVGVVQ